MVYLKGGTGGTLIVNFFSIIRKFFYKSVLMTVGGGEAARMNLFQINLKGLLYKIEDDFNFLVNFFFGSINFKGNCHITSAAWSGSRRAKTRKTENN